MQVSPFPNNPKQLDPFYKMDLDFFWTTLEGKKTTSYNQRNTVVKGVRNFGCFISLSCYCSADSCIKLYMCMKAVT